MTPGPGRVSGPGRKDSQGREVSAGRRSELTKKREYSGDSNRDKCKFDGRCERILNCPFIHSLEDFPLLQGRNNPIVRNNTNLRRN